ncbi:uncharacterized protein DS421_11g319700 [Arachis hypogaea]|nr:uncharacterized protein DS421_11g319700 [Arachis hypogaea]
MGNNSSVESSEEFSEKIDIGLSATVTITDNRWSASSGLEFKGPFQHPASALFHMFDEFRKNKYPHYLPPR